MKSQYSEEQNSIMNNVNSTLLYSHMSSVVFVPLNPSPLGVFFGAKFNTDI